MKRILMTGASVLALGIAPLIAQEQTISPGGDANSPYLGVQSEEGGNRELRTRQNRSQGDRSGDDGPARDAMGDPPVQPGASADAGPGDPWNRGMPFPPQDVSDQDLEPHGQEYPSEPPPERSASVEGGDDGSDDLIQEGEQVPEDFSRYQGEDMWEGDGARDVDEDRGPSTRAEKRGRKGDERLSAERGPAYAWDGRGAGREFDRGELHPDRSDTGAVEESGRTAGQENPRARREAMDRDARGERRLRLARIALRTARHAVPDARFGTYEFEIEGGRRVIEIGGADLENGRRVEVDVYPNGRVHSISEAVPLEAVPDSVRDAVRSELGRFRVAHSLRSLRRNLDVYYEFAGFSSSGRPAEVEIRADGRDMSVRYLDRS